MPVLKLPKIFSTDFSIPDRNPIDPVEVNWDWEMTRGLATLNVAPDLERDIVHPNTVTSGSPPAAFVDQIGRGGDFDGSSNFIRNTTTVPSDYPFTFFASFSNAGSVFGGIVGIGGSGSTTHRTALTASGTNMLMMRAQTFGGNNSEINVIYDGSEPVTHIVGVYNSATDRKFFINGELVGTATSSVPGNVFNRFTLGRWDDATPGQHFGGVMYIAGHFQRTMSEAEALSLSKNVFQLLKPTSPPVYFISSVAPGGVTVDVPVGALVLTGQAPTIDATDDKAVEVPLGALSLAGLTPTVIAQAPVEVEIPAGALSLTGLTPVVDVAAAVTVDIPTGALSLTGFLPTVVAPNAISVPLGALLLTGFAPSIIAGTTVEIPLGALNLLGFAPNIDLTDNQTVSIPLGALTLTGFAPVVDFGNQAVEIPLGSLNLTGFIPAILAQGIIWTVQADAVTNWAEQADTSTTWAEQTDDSTTWTIQ